MVLVVKVKTFLKNNLLLIVILLGAFSLFMLSEPIRLGHCSGNVIVVPDNYPKISWAVGNASEGDTILVKCENYYEWDIPINKTLTIIGENAQTTVIDGEGIANYLFHVTASNVVIQNVTLQNTDLTSEGPAIRIYNATNVMIENVMTRNVYYGVQIRSSNFTKITHCRFSESSYSGIYLHDASCNNTFVVNTIENNSYAVYIAESTSQFNTFHHNNFINNTHQIESFGGLNYFDNGYPSGGNYWSDHVAADLKNGPYPQSEVGSDGILDEGYPAGAFTPLDNYPLAHPVTSLVVTVDENTFDVQVLTNSTLTAYNFSLSEKCVSLFISGLEGSSGACRVSIPKELLSCEYLGNWTVSIYQNSDEQALQCLSLEDMQSTYLYFEYNLTATDSKIKITGTKVLTETISLAVALFALVSLTLTLWATISLKKKK